MALFNSKKSTEITTQDKKTSSVSHVASHIVKPHITEKAYRLSEKNQYVFVVDGSATKNDVKKEIQKTYNVTITGVQATPIEARITTYKGKQNKKSRGKKMIVTVKEGQKIDFTGNM